MICKRFAKTIQFTIRIHLAIQLLKLIKLAANNRFEVEEIEVEGREKKNHSNQPEGWFLQYLLQNQIQVQDNHKLMIKIQAMNMQRKF